MSFASGEEKILNIYFDLRNICSISAVIALLLTNGKDFVLKCVQRNGPASLIDKVPKAGYSHDSLGIFYISQCYDVLVKNKI